MSFQVTPDLVQTAAQNLANIHSTLEGASASVASPTTGMVAAAEDEVSAGVAALFNSFGQEYQVISAQAQAFHSQFVNLLNAGAGAYLSTEIANAEQNLLNAVGSPVQGLVGEAAGASGGAVAAVASSLGQPAFPILGGLLGGTPVGPLLSGLGGGAPVGPLLGGLGGTPVGPLLGGLGGGSLVSSLNRFVTSLADGSVFQLLPAQIGAGLQLLSRDIAALPIALQSYGGTLAPSLLHAGASTGGAGPYQTLLDDTIANLQTLGGALSANPTPFLHQVITNATGYAHTIAADLQYVFQNFPAVLASVPANIQAAIQGLLTFNPAPYIQQFIHNQMVYANILATSLQNAGHDFLIGLQGLPAAFQSAYQAFLAGNVSGAVGDLAQGFLGLFVTGVDVTVTGGSINIPGTSDVIASITPTGTIGDLLPILTIPGMQAQNFTNLLPAGSIAHQISQNATNVIKTLTDTSLVAEAFLTVSVVFPPFPPSVSVAFGLDANAGLPVALTLDALGAPVNALGAAGAGASQFFGELQTGNTIGALTTLLDGPAYVTNAFLNGQSTLPLTFDVGGLPLTLNLPLDGILVPQTPYTASLDLSSLGFGKITENIGGTPISGLATGLLVYAPEQLAKAIS